MFTDMGIAYVISVTILVLFTIQVRKNYQLQVLLTEEKALKLQLMHHEKDKLFSIISHDLNAPIASLKQYLDLLSEVNWSPRSVVIEHDLAAAVSDTQELLSNLLEWSKSQMNKAKANLEELYLRHTISSTVSIFRQIALQKGITLQMNVDDDIIITADINMLQLITRNLINNRLSLQSNRE